MKIIIKDIAELVNNGVISPETADKIQSYYKSKKEQSTNRLFSIFLVLGAIFVGLGIILIIAHNWAELPQFTKTCFAFLPLVLAQYICGFALLGKQDKANWKETVSVFLFFSIAANLALVSQIYNIHGEPDTFLLTWLLLGLPLVYVVPSSLTSLLYILGITCYGLVRASVQAESYSYWALLLAVMPHYYLLYKKEPAGNFMNFHNWLIALSVMMALRTIADQMKPLIQVAYLSLFGLFYLIGNLDFFIKQRSGKNSYKILGSLGAIFWLMVLSFYAPWENLDKKNLLFNEAIISPELIASYLMLLFTAGLLYQQQKETKRIEIKSQLAVVVPLILIVFLLTGVPTLILVAFVNLVLLVIGVITIRDGVKQAHLATLNFGLLMTAVWIVCRFLDSDFSFVLRGFVFVVIGAGFFAANYYMLKKRKILES